MQLVTRSTLASLQYTFDALVVGVDSAGNYTGGTSLGEDWGDLVVGEHSAMATSYVLYYTQPSRGGVKRHLGMVEELTLEGNQAAFPVFYPPEGPCGWWLAGQELWLYGGDCHQPVISVTSLVAGPNGGSIMSLSDGRVFGPGDGFDRVHLSYLQPSGAGTYLGVGDSGVTNVSVTTSTTTTTGGSPSTSVWAYGGGNAQNANAPVPRLLTTARLRELATMEGIGIGLSGIQLNRAIGLAFQGFSIFSLQPSGADVQPNTTAFPSPVREVATGGTVKTVIPDAVLDHVTNGLISITYRKSAFYEVKAVAGTMTLSYSRQQLRGLIDVATRSPLAQASLSLANPTVTFVTTADTFIGADVVAEASVRHVEIRQIIAVEVITGRLALLPSISLNTSSFERTLGLALGGHPKPATDGHLKTGHHTA